MEIPVYREERPAGALRLRREGERTAVEMECALDRSGLVRFRREGAPAAPGTPAGGGP